MSKVILTRDHRGLGKRGEVYDCPNDEVADKLIRLGRAVVSEADLPCAEPVPEASVKPALPVFEHDTDVLRDIGNTELADDITEGDAE